MWRCAVLILAAALPASAATHDARDLTLDGFHAGTAAADLFLRVTGARSSGIILTGNDLSRARRAVEGPALQKQRGRARGSTARRRGDRALRKDTRHETRHP